MEKSKEEMMGEREQSLVDYMQQVMNVQRESAALTQAKEEFSLNEFELIEIKAKNDDLQSEKENIREDLI